MTRPAQVVINLSALRHNYSRVRSLAPNSQIITIVKADAYGHGLVRVATTLCESDAYGVASIEEAIELRDAGINKPIILLEGPFSIEELAIIDKLKFEIVVHNNEQIRMIEKSLVTGPLKVWLKVDTGMHRLGFEPDEVIKSHQRLGESGKISQPISLMTHLVNASDPSSELTDKQLGIFQDCCNGIPGARSIANSAGIVAWPKSHADYVRPGLMLYGISPIEGGVAADYDLMPVMTLKSRLISIKVVKRDEHVGYGAEWICPEDMPVGIVAAGYGDGYPRHANSGTPVIVNGQATQVIGNPSMDMIAIDLRNINEVQLGDPVELWGNAQPVEEVSNHAGTIPYELVSGVHKRLHVLVNE
jgi:alanine racemase